MNNLKFLYGKLVGMIFFGEEEGWGGEFLCYMIVKKD